MADPNGEICIKLTWYVFEVNWDFQSFLTSAHCSLGIISFKKSLYILSPLDFLYTQFPGVLTLWIATKGMQSNPKLQKVPHSYSWNTTGLAGLVKRVNQSTKIRRDKIKKKWKGEGSRSFQFRILSLEDHMVLNCPDGVPYHWSCAFNWSLHGSWLRRALFIICLKVWSFTSYYIHI